MYIVKCDNCGEEGEFLIEKRDLMLTTNGELCEAYSNKIIISEPADIYRKRVDYLLEKDVDGLLTDDVDDIYIMPRTKTFNFCCMNCLIKLANSNKLKTSFDDWKEFADRILIKKKRGI